MVDTNGIGWRKALGVSLVAAVALVTGTAAAACAAAEASRTAHPIVGLPPAAAGIVTIAEAMGDLARVVLDAPALPAGTTVTLTQDSPPALYPQLIVVTAAPHVPLSARATLILPYNDDLVRDWQIEDETRLGVFERNAQGTWRWSPALVNPVTNTVVLQVDALAVWTVGPSWMM